jgi:hypothetical protein
VNFVLHHFLARRDLGTGLAAVGAMLPDVWRMADRRARPAMVPVVSASDAPRVAAVLDGVAHHARADAAFHVCAPFADGERLVARDLAAIGAPKLALFAHVAWEITLDGALLRREGAARIVDVVRADIADAARDDALDAAARLHHTARGREVPPALASRVDRVLGEIARGPWVTGYASAEGLAARLEGVRTRLALAPLSVEHRAALVDAFAAALARADEAVPDVLRLLL